MLVKNQGHEEDLALRAPLLTVMRLDQLLDQVQPEAGAAVLVGRARVDLQVWRLRVAVAGSPTLRT